MNYIKANKKAWEEAFRHRKNGWGEDVSEKLQSKPDFYINPTIKPVLDQQDLSSKRAAHISDIGEAYHGSFDLVLFTIGAITWFKDLEVLFHVVSRCLKPKGVMILHMRSIQL